MEIETRSHGWICPKCKKFNRAKMLHFRCNTKKRCICGQRVQLDIGTKMETIYIITGGETIVKGGK